MIGVIDTSALIRIFIPDGPIPEGLEVFLQGVESGAHIAIAPELMLVEVGSVLHKKQRREELSIEEADTLMGLMQAMPIRFHGHMALMKGALQLARQQNLTVYDALFLDLALQKGAKLYSGDEQLCRVAGSLGLETT